jgi:hypothetical protein
MTSLHTLFVDSYSYYLEDQVRSEDDPNTRQPITNFHVIPLSTIFSLANAWCFTPAAVHTPQSTYLTLSSRLQINPGTRVGWDISGPSFLFGPLTLHSSL